MVPSDPRDPKPQRSPKAPNKTQKGKETAGTAEEEEGEGGDGRGVPEPYGGAVERGRDLALGGDPRAVGSWMRMSVSHCFHQCNNMVCLCFIQLLMCTESKSLLRYIQQFCLQYVHCAAVWVCSSRVIREVCDFTGAKHSKGGQSRPPAMVDNRRDRYAGAPESEAQREPGEYGIYRVRNKYKIRKKKHECNLLANTTYTSITTYENLK